MKTPGRILADWIVDDPRRFTMTPRTDRAFYTALYNFAAALIVVAIVVVVAAVI